MNRRGFFGLFAGATAAAIALPNFELLLPKRTIFLPPAGGWMFGPFTPHLIAREMLISIEQHLQFAANVDREYNLLHGSQWAPHEMSRVVIRKPLRLNVIASEGPLL